jgi:hypothetical protein
MIVEEDFLELKQKELDHQEAIDCYSNYESRRPHHHCQRRCHIHQERRQGWCPKLRLQRDSVKMRKTIFGAAMPLRMITGRNS